MKTNIEFVERDVVNNLINEISSDSLFLVIDEVIKEKYPEEFHCLDGLENKSIHTYIVKAGESLKTMSEYEKCIEFMIENKIHRNSHIIAIGGGTVSDFAGFVAATVLRGVAFSIIPTTILGMSDAAIGGKVGINSKYGKNLIGQFHMPDHVFIYTDFINTLPKEEVSSGHGEVIKYAFLDKNIYSAIINERRFQDVLRMCIEFKNKIVELDFNESGTRKILNLGHTFGHIFEVRFKLPHGIAVVYGMDFLFRIFECECCLSKLREITEKLDFPPIDKSLYAECNENILDVLANDKKVISNDLISVIKIKDLGMHSIEDISLEKLKTLAASVMGKICS